MSCDVQACVAPFAIWCALRMAYLKEQHVCIKCCFKLWKNAVETFKMFEFTLADQTVECTQALSDFPNSEVV
jgi:hypothetical protein